MTEEERITNAIKATSFLLAQKQVHGISHAYLKKVLTLLEDIQKIGLNPDTREADIKELF